MTREKRGGEGKGGAAVDWTEVRRRVNALGEAAAMGPTPQRDKEILRSRAAALSREPAEENAAGENLEILEFLLAHERYGIEISCIRETIPLKEFTPVPCTPPFVLGLVNVRGRIVSVIDVKRFFDLPEKGITDLNKVIVLHDGEMEFGILADAVIGVTTIPPAELRPSLPTLTGIREEYLKGVTGDRLVVLDGKRLLRDRKIVVHDEIED